MQTGAGDRGREPSARRRGGERTRSRKGGSSHTESWTLTSRGAHALEQLKRVGRTLPLVQLIVAVPCARPERREESGERARPERGTDKAGLDSRAHRNLP